MNKFFSGISLVAGIALGTLAITPSYEKWLKYEDKYASNQKRLKEEDRIMTIKKEVAYIL
jgi:hypothetical protein